MRPIPKKLREEMAEDPYYKRCARVDDEDHTCSGRISWEHACYYKGKQVQEKWAIIPLCEKAHNLGRWQNGGDLNKRRNKEIALSRATEEDLIKYPHHHWQQHQCK